MVPRYQQAKQYARVLVGAAGAATFVPEACFANGWLNQGVCGLN
jgi:hypothetical protein